MLRVSSELRRPLTSIGTDRHDFTRQRKALTGM
jgi:hypothetical protein